MEAPAELRMDWRGICESMFKRIMLWETDYREDANDHCAHDLHQVLVDNEEQWQRLAEWEMAHEEGQSLEEWEHDRAERGEACWERVVANSQPFIMDADPELTAVVLDGLGG